MGSTSRARRFAVVGVTAVAIGIAVSSGGVVAAPAAASVPASSPEAVSPDVSSCTACCEDLQSPDTDTIVTQVIVAGSFFGFCRMTTPYGQDSSPTREWLPGETAITATVPAVAGEYCATTWTYADGEYTGGGKNCVSY